MHDIDVEGQFMYTDRTAVDYYNWRDGEPNNLINEDCVDLLVDGTMNDQSCLREKYFVCKCIV